MKERHIQLLEYITHHGKAEVGVLAEYLQISKVTVRKDLDYLSERKLLKRERGYAVPGDFEDSHYRMAFRFKEKQQIARAAAACVQDGETILVESGSTCALFAEELAMTKKNITIITNSIYLADYVRTYPNIQLILLGGVLQRGSQTMVGTLTKSGVAVFHTDKIFVGTDGYSRDFGFTGDDLMRADTLSSMVACADHVYVLAGSDKLDKQGAVSFLALNDVYELITDKDIPLEEQQYLRSRGIKVTIAESF